jgi:hypothetical protein
MKETKMITDCVVKDSAERIKAERLEAVVESIHGWTALLSLDWGETNWDDIEEYSEDEWLEASQQWLNILNGVESLDGFAELDADQQEAIARLAIWLGVERMVSEGWPWTKVEEAIATLTPTREQGREIKSPEWLVMQVAADMAEAKLAAEGWNVRLASVVAHKPSDTVRCEITSSSDGAAPRKCVAATHELVDEWSSIKSRANDMCWQCQCIVTAIKANGLT